MATGEGQSTDREVVRVDSEEWTKEPPHGRFYMRIFISVVVLGACLYVVLSDRYPSDTAKWAFGTIGLIIGYWLPK